MDNKPSLEEYKTVLLRKIRAFSNTTSTGNEIAWTLITIIERNEIEYDISKEIVE